MQELVKEFNRENLKPIIFIIIVLIVTAITAYPQRKFGGTVVEVVNGKTAVIRLSTGGKINAILQFIEIPEAEQPLYQTVKEHLEALVLGKTVLFQPRRVLQEGSVGQLILNGADISQQMLRDGAAWYALPEKNAQDASESEIYQTTEAQARAEKRGVWGVENMKTAWEFRAQKQEELKKKQEIVNFEAEIAAMRKVSENKPSTIARQKKKTVVNVSMWSSIADVDTAAGSDLGSNLISGAVPKTNLSFLGTCGNSYFVEDEKTSIKIEARVFYIFSEDRKTGYFVIGILAESPDYNFAASNSLTLIAEDGKGVWDKGFRLARQLPYTAQELLIYKVDATTLLRLSHTNDVKMRLGNFAGTLDAEFAGDLKELLRGVNIDIYEKP
ncbi:MAG: thermonuclease family protein [Pyrinomonadaceae bacterium]